MSKKPAPRKTRSSSASLAEARKAAKPQPADLSKVNVVRKPGETDHEAIARYGTNPNVLALATITSYQVTMPKEHVRADAVLSNLNRQAASVQAGDLSGPEEMLSAHAHTLDALFHNMAHRAHRNLQAGYIANAETYLRLALKAQSQCRTTIEALAEIKYPKSATFIRQQNIANQQQVNNGAAPASASTHPLAPEKNITPTNELLGVDHGKRLDTGAQSAAGGAHSGMETVGAVNRAKD